MMRPVAIIACLLAGLVLSACAQEGGDAKELRNLTIEQVSETRFAVSIEALNVDGYQLARCVAAAYVDGRRDAEGKRLHDVYVRDGGKLTDEFRLVDGVRVQRTTGLQTYSFAKKEEHDVQDHDGRDVMAVDLQLAECEKLDLPTKLGEG